MDGLRFQISADDVFDDRVDREESVSSVLVLIERFTGTDPPPTGSRRGTPASGLPPDGSRSARAACRQAVGPGNASGEPLLSLAAYDTVFI
ncbi:hypothetical protein [Nonomuraea solani]|uniref:hypothetical protein n=1 Tax=Nonomuraea solani TaxID=1144553 RepID=UPI000CDE85C4|nr:hypothetical protein [Nonomuraea solani]